MKLDELVPLSAKDPMPQGDQNADDEDDDEEEGVLSRGKLKPATTMEDGDDAAAASAAVVEDGVEKEANGKKKGTRKKRSLNWEEAERGLLLEIIKPKVEFVENRSVDAKSIRTKRMTWTNITKQFNAHNFRHRLLEQIQVQWRSMKNTAKRDFLQKHPKSEVPDGMRLVEFMEEMQKESVGTRSQTRGAPTKKEIHEISIDEDEDMPLAALPISINPIEDPLQTSSMTLPSPPPSTPSGESQQDGSSQPPAAVGNRRKTHSFCNGNTVKLDDSAVSQDKLTSATKRAAALPSLNRKRPRLQAKLPHASDNVPAESSAPEETPPNGNDKPDVAGDSRVNHASDTNPDEQRFEFITPEELDCRLKRRLFRLVKQSRLAEMDNARREHEEKIRLQRKEMDLKLAYFRQEHDLKLRHMRDEFEIHMRQQKAEHEARMQAYTATNNRYRTKPSTAVKSEEKEESSSIKFAANPMEKATTMKDCN